MCECPARQGRAGRGGPTSCPGVWHGNQPCLHCFRPQRRNQPQHKRWGSEREPAPMEGETMMRMVAVKIRQHGEALTWGGWSHVVYRLDLAQRLDICTRMFFLPPVLLYFKLSQILRFFVPLGPGAVQAKSSHKPDSTQIHHRKAIFTHVQVCLLPTPSSNKPKIEGLARVARACLRLARHMPC